MSDLVDFLSLSNPFEQCSDNFPGQLCQPGGIYKDPTAWLYGARPPHNYSLKNDIDKLIILTYLDPKITL